MSAMDQDMEDVETVVATRGPSELSHILDTDNVLSSEEIAAKVNDVILSQDTTKLKLEAAQMFLEMGERMSDGVGAAVTEAWSVIFENKLWEDSFATEVEAKQQLDNSAIRSIRTTHGQVRRRKDKAITTIKREWNQDVQSIDFGGLAETTLENIAGVSKILTYAEAVHCVWHKVIDRLQLGGSGRASSKKPERKEWHHLRSIDGDARRALLEREPLTEADVHRYGLKLSDLVIAPLLPGAEAPLVPRLEGRAKSSHKAPKRRKANVMTEDDSELSSDEDSGDEEMMSDIEHTNVENPISDDEDLQHDDSGNISEASTEVEMDEDSSEDSSEDNNDSEYENDDKEENEEVIRAENNAAVSGCRCIATGISKALLTRVCRKSPLQANADTESSQIKLLGRFVEKNARLNGYCRYHLAAVAAKLGFQVKTLKCEDIARRLRKYWTNRADIQSFMLQDTTKNWWRYRFAGRPVFESDALGVYSHSIQHIDTLSISEEHAKLLVESIQTGAWDEFSETGNVVVHGLFDYLWSGITIEGVHEPGVESLLDEEFQMYLYHQSERNGVHNKGWLRTMFYSLAQQAVRQDLAYYTLYVALRPDRNPRLIAYPYYAKYAVGGDPTSFRHLDLNVKKYLESGRGAEIIQGSVSFDDEVLENCTELVLGFHKHIAQWWADVESRGRSCDGWITGLGKRWSDEDAEKYGDFVTVPCKRGDARITMPEIPHGSTGPAPENGVRRTILPWFVGVQDDGETLDNEQSDSWSSLVVHYTAQTAPKLTPSGFSNKYGPPPYRFPGSSQLVLESRVSNALVCRVPWSDAQVLKEARVLLGQDREKAWSVIQKGRLNALQKFKTAWTESKEAEMQAYGQNSFFRRR